MDKMVNWSLQPDDPVEVPEVVEEAPSTTDATEPVESTPDPMEELTKRMASLEEANKQAEAIANDLRRSVGRVQSLVDRMDKATGSTKAELQGSLDERINELSAILGDVAGNIDDAILPTSVKEKVRNAQAQAAQRAAAVSIDKMVADKVQELLPQTQPTNEVPLEWRAFELNMEKQIRDAGLNPDDSSMFDWRYVGSLLAQGRRPDAEKYFENILEPHVAGTKLQAKKETAAPSPTGTTTAGSSTNWWDKLADPKVPLEEKAKIMKEQKLL